MKSPFPWFGGKSRVAHVVWQHFGAVQNYVEPFFGSGAVLLGRPGWQPGTVETVNDADCYLANFWRAIRHNPEEVVAWADWPVNEADLLARHRWLIKQTEFRERMRQDPDYHDAKIAGWWVWGQCAWIGNGWCQRLSSKLPHLGNAGRGINRRLPHLGDRGEWIAEWFKQLSARLRDVRVACGDWARVLGPSVTYKHGLTAVFLDPPYSDDCENPYSDQTSVSAEVARWALENGDHPKLRIALCGYEGEHAIPDSWIKIRWKTAGGYGSQGKRRGSKNKLRETIWFSPY